MLPIQLQSRWINAQTKKHTAKGHGISCAVERADFVKAFVLRSHFEHRVIGTGKAIEIGGKFAATAFPKAVTWHNNVVESSTMLALRNVTKDAMDHKFLYKTPTSIEETTTIRQLSLSQKVGKAVILLESRDIDSEGRWIVSVASANAEHLKVIVATVTSKLYENGQIPAANHMEEAPTIDKQMRRRRSNKSAVSASDDDDMSIQSVHAKAWSDVAMSDNGSAPKPSTDRGPSQRHFSFNPACQDEQFPPLPPSVNAKPSTENSSIGSVTTVTKSDLELFQSKIAKDMETSLKQHQQIMTSSVTNATQSSAIDELRAEQLAMSIKNKAIREAKRGLAMNVENEAIRDEQNQQQSQMMTMFMSQMQHMISSFMNSQGPSAFNPSQQQQQFEHQRQQNLAQQQHQQHQQQLAQQRQHSPQKSQDLFTHTHSHSQL
jgi:hypothetical protein